MDSTWKNASLLFLLAVLPFLPALNAGFLNWDDDLYLTENPSISSPDGWRETLSRFSSDANIYPVVFASFRLENRLWGMNPLGYHASNIVLHGFVVVLLFALFLRLGAEERVAWWAALLFAIHPMQVATVAWVTERKSLLGCLFLLGAWLLYLTKENRNEALPGRKPVGFLAWLSLPFAALSYLSKSSLVIFPVLLVAVDRLRSKRAKTPILWWVHLALAVSLGWVYASREVSGGLSFFERVFLVPRSLAHYLVTWTWPFSLSGIYPKWNVHPLNPTNLLCALLFVAVGTFLVFFRRRFARIEWTAILLFFLPLVPALGLAQFGYQRHSFVSDHFAYLALSGLSLAAVSLGARGLGAAGWRLWPVCIPIAVVWGVCAWMHCGMWQSSNRFWERSVCVAGESWVAHQNYATVLDSQQRFEEALSHYRRAVDIDPEEPIGWVNLGRCLARVGKHTEALESLQHAIERNPYYLAPHLLLAEVYAREKREKDVHDTLTKGLEIHPDSIELRLRLAGLHLHAASEEIRNPTAAVRLLQPLLDGQSGPKETECLALLAEALAQQGAFNRAVEIENERLQLIPEAERETRARIRRRISFLEKGFLPGKPDR